MKSAVLSSLFISLLGVNVCSNAEPSKTVTLRLLNLEDYIYIQESDTDLPDMTRQFELAMAEEGYDVKVIYETSDTNESEYNDLLTGRTSYDLVCTSDYMLAKFAREGLITAINRNYLPNYLKYSSPTIRERLDSIPVIVKDEQKYLKDYAVGYMWGTLGILFNPTYNEHFMELDPLNDMASFDCMWNKEYKGTMSLKDSMRDTYAVALMYSYDKEAPKDMPYSLSELKARHDEGLMSDSEYNEMLSVIFNLTDDDTLAKVTKALGELKENIFGMEVDSGKEDIVTGKIGINLAWSGDAVYSMDQAEEEKGLELYYSVPVNGSNIWFDGWCIPANDSRSEDSYYLAHRFLDFISTPEFAAQNMDYTGYTSYIGGDDILDLAKDWYDARTDLIYNEIELEDEEIDYASLFYYLDGELEEVWYSDCHYIEDTDHSYDNVELYYGHGVYDDEENLINVPDLQKLNEKYNERLIIDPEWTVVDLSYFFNGTLDEYVDNEDTIFYTDYYVEENGGVGRQFFCQYPDEAAINRCAVMQDYGDRNTAVVKLWENFKSNALPVWAIILLIVEIVLIVGAMIIYLSNKQIKRRLREKRLQNK